MLASRTTVAVARAQATGLSNLRRPSRTGGGSLAVFAARDDKRLHSSQMPKRVLIAADVEPSLLSLLRNDERFDVIYKPAREIHAIDDGCEILITRTFNKVTDAVMK